MWGIIFLLVFVVGVPGLFVYAIKKDNMSREAEAKKKAQQTRELSMAYLRNRGGSAVGLKEFLFRNHFTSSCTLTSREEEEALMAASCEAELALAQYLDENPIDREIPTEPVFKKE